MPKLVYDFTEGNKDLKDLLGGKGANLAEMTNLGLPVPPGFIITTEACRQYLRTGDVPDGLDDEVSDAPAARWKRRWAGALGDPADPLLVSVRSGGKFSMPGMMETVLNIGLSDESVHGPGQAGGQRALRLGLLPPADPDVRQDRARHRRRGLRAHDGRGQERQGHHATTSTWTPTTCSKIVDDVQGASCASRPAASSRRTRGSRWTWRSGPCSAPGTPTGPCSTGARSASPRTSAPRSTSCAMVFGNLGMDSGTGVAFTRDPGTGAAGRLR